MSLINIQVDVHCVRPPWAIHNPKFNNPSYRIYLDKDLLTERTWRWEDSIYIREDLWVNIERDKHSLRLDPILKLPEQAFIRFENFVIANAAQGVVSTCNVFTVQDNEITFSI